MLLFTTKMLAIKEKGENDVLYHLDKVEAQHVYFQKEVFFPNFLLPFFNKTFVGDKYDVPTRFFINGKQVDHPKITANNNVRNTEYFIKGYDDRGVLRSFTDLIYHGLYGYVIDVNVDKLLKSEIFKRCLFIKSEITGHETFLLLLSVDKSNRQSHERRREQESKFSRSLGFSRSGNNEFEEELLNQTHGFIITPLDMLDVMSLFQKTEDSFIVFTGIVQEKMFLSSVTIFGLLTHFPRGDNFYYIEDFYGKKVKRDDRSNMLSYQS